MLKFEKMSVAKRLRVAPSPSKLVPDTLKFVCVSLMLLSGPLKLLFSPLKFDVMFFKVGVEKLV